MQDSKSGLGDNMYLHLGEDVTIRDKDILAVIDLDSVAMNHDNRDFLRNAEKQGKVIYVSQELPKTAVVCKDCIYICQVAAATLERRNRR